jgi:hypothetical protein
MWTWLFSTRDIITRGELKEIIVGAQQDAVNQITAQLDKAKGEIVGKIDDLQRQIDNGETPDLAPLRQVAQSLDDVVPDQVPDGGDAGEGGTAGQAGAGELGADATPVDQASPGDTATNPDGDTQSEPTQ